MSAALGHNGPATSALKKITTPSTGKRKRTVPDELRRRAAASCDRCKLRRSKCIKEPSNSQCTNCQAAGVECESKLPRKQRLYGSVESLSLRYRVLDALAKGLFPDVDTGDVEKLLEIGREKGIQGLPSLDESSPILDIFGQGHALPPALPTQPARPATIGRIPSMIKVPRQQAASPGAGDREKLIPAPHGIGHYVGPSSSLGFAAAVRKLVSCASCNPKFKISQRQQNALRVDFVTLIVNKALERRADAQRNQAEHTADAATESQGAIDLRKGLGTMSGFLPSREVSDSLVEAFFNDLHPNYPLFDRHVFDSQYTEMWHNGQEQNASDMQPGWVCCMCLLFVFGAQALPSCDRMVAIAIQKHYLSLARTYTDMIISTTSVHNIQALMLLQLYYHNIGERNASWMILGCAVRMAVAMGLHREGANAGIDIREKNIRKSIWWTLYTFEKNLCIVLGRPSSIDENEVSVTFPDEAMEARTGLAGLTSATVSLTRLGYKIKQELYGPPNQSSDEDAMTVAARKLLQELDEWDKNLPNHLRAGWSLCSPTQHRLIRLLRILHQQTRALITRPFLMAYTNSEILALDQNQRNPVPVALKELSGHCISAAEDMLQQAKVMLERGLVNGVCWIDAYYIYFACFLLCLPLVSHAVDGPDSVEEKAHKELVKHVLLGIRSMRLAPTFRILIHVASQFASLVGALGDMAIESDESLGNSGTQVEQITHTPDPQTSPSVDSLPTPNHQPDSSAYTTMHAMTAPYLAPLTPQSRPRLATLPTRPDSHLAKDWSHLQPSPAQAADDLPWDFMGAHAGLGQPLGYANDWYSSSLPPANSNATPSGAAAWDEMMFPALVGCTFGVWGNGGITTNLDAWGQDEWTAGLEGAQSL